MLSVSMVWLKDSDSPTARRASSTGGGDDSDDQLKLGKEKSFLLQIETILYTIY
jgi:hypothetical protein